MTSPTPRSSLLALLVVSLSLGAGAQSPVVIPAGTPLPVQIDDHLRMRLGQSISAKLLYPVYADNTLILPAATILNGTVVELHANRARRNSARLRGDFTPFRTPVVRFTEIRLADGTTQPITADTATDGAPIYRLVAPPHRKGGFIHQRVEDGKQLVKDRLAVITGPNKGDRALQFLYSQLPNHPQRIEKGTAWTVETTAPLSLVASSASAVVPIASIEPPTAEPAPWIIQAYLSAPITSASSTNGTLIHATVAEPIYNADHTIAVPQGSTIVGAITQAKPARMFGRAGVLRFAFKQIILPSGQSQSVAATVTGMDSASPQQLAMDSEGNVKPKPQDKILVPLLLLAAAARPLDQDHGTHHQLGKNAAASNSIGVAGFILGTAARQANLAAGIGYYGAAIALYERWIKRGTEVAFARDTRIVLQTTPRSSAVLKPNTP